MTHRVVESLSSTADEVDPVSTVTQFEQPLIHITPWVRKPRPHGHCSGCSWSNRLVESLVS